jgi:hypothetical protein
MHVGSAVSVKVWEIGAGPCYSPLKFDPNRILVKARPSNILSTPVIPYHAISVELVCVNHISMMVTVYIRPLQVSPVFALGKFHLINILPSSVALNKPPSTPIRLNTEIVGLAVACNISQMHWAVKETQPTRLWIVYPWGRIRDILLVKVSIISL